MEGDAGAESRLNPTDADGPPQAGGAPTSEELVPEANAEETASEAPAEEAVTEESVQAQDARRPSLLGRGWMVAVCAVLLVLSAGVAAAGYLALRAHTVSAADARAEAAALQAAKTCVEATQAPDTAAVALSQQKMIECSTGDFGVQATVYSGVLVEAYQAANAQVRVSDLRAAVERHNDDGSIQVLVAVRVKVTNSAAADQEQGYRLRVRMAPNGGAYKIARLDQVSN
jgi:Mce-associated membrane protein